MALVGVHCATLIGHPTPKIFTGHFGRRTGATIAANRGLQYIFIIICLYWHNTILFSYVGATLPQLKIMGNWISERAASGYITVLFKVTCSLLNRFHY